MALTPEDLAQLGEFIDGKIKSAVGENVTAAVAEATTPKPQTNDEPQNQPENQPEYWVHLADGSVQVSRDSASTHMTNEAGETVQVIGRFPRVTV
jgi:hypothetical protein